MRRQRDRARVRRSRNSAVGLAPSGSLTSDPAGPVRTGFSGLLGLQRAVGNAFVGQTLQARMTVSQPGDPHEREAERVAEAVVRMTENPPTSGPPDREEGFRPIQRMCTECEEELGRQAIPVEEEEPDGKFAGLQRQASPRGGEETGLDPATGEVRRVTRRIEADIRDHEGGGRPLSEPVRTHMESRMGYDLGPVRIHTDARADRLARSVGAEAFTVGRNVVFGSGMYRPDTASGKRLLAHELTHVVQQTGAGGRLRRLPVRSESGDPTYGSVPLREGAELEQRPDSTSPSRTGSSRSVVQRACRSGSWEYEYDGCSLPPPVSRALGIADKDNPAGGRDTHFGTRGRYGGRPCDDHDRCYQTCGADQAICDMAMLMRMNAVCAASSEPPAVKRECYKWAGVYYAGLRTGGGPAHAQRQAQVCSCELSGAAREGWEEVESWF